MPTLLDEMWDVVTDGSIQIMKVNIAYSIDSNADQYSLKPKMEWNSDDITIYNLNNIACDILFKSVDENIFLRVKIFPTAKEVWDKLMRIGEENDQEKDNKLTVAMNSFEDFKQLPNETISDMHARFLKVVDEIKGLRKEIRQEEICLKVFIR